MKNVLPAGLRRDQFVDSDTWSECLYRNQIRPDEGYDLGEVTGYWGDQLRMIYGDDPHEADLYGSEEWLQKQRPDIFVRKLRSRRMFGRKSPPKRGERSDSTFITAAEFARQYAAVAFALNHGLTCETAVTLWWRELGTEDAASVKKLFSKFLKCLNDWLYERDLPTVYFFCHENSVRAGLHTHLALYLCQSPHKDRTVRDQFVLWCRAWIEKQAPGARPARAARITGPAQRSEWLHWQRFHYQMKGYDPHAVVRTALNSADRRDLLLGDLIAYHWQDPGVVTLEPRVGYSLSLGPDRRQAGVPAGCDELRSEERKQARERQGTPLRTSVFAPPSAEPGSPLPPAPTSVDFQWYVPPRQPIRVPFVSRYDDGHRNVWDLYPRDFNEKTMRLSYEQIMRRQEAWECDPSDPLYQPLDLPLDFLSR